MLYHRDYEYRPALLASGAGDRRSITNQHHVELCQISFHFCLTLQPPLDLVSSFLLVLLDLRPTIANMSSNCWKTTHKPILCTIANFDLRLFAVCLATGILAVNFQVLPYQFNGLGIISIIFWVAEMLLFFTFLALFCTRAIIFPKSLKGYLGDDIESPFYIATIPISLTLIVQMTALVLNGRTWAGFDTVALVFWYILLVSCQALF